MRRARHFDWSVVAEEVMAVYETVTHGAGRVRADMSGDTRWTRLLRGLSRTGEE
jgi:phosphatidylinositol alpha-mannosyltransferase